MGNNIESVSTIDRVITPSSYLVSSVTTGPFNKGSFRESLRSNSSSRYSVRLDADGNALPLTTYRIGSVSQDTNLCLWDITSDVLNNHLSRNRTSSNIAARLSVDLSVTNSAANSCSNSVNTTGSGGATGNLLTVGSNPPLASPTLSNGTRGKRNFTLGHRDKNSVRSTAAIAQQMKQGLDGYRLLGSQYCPKLDQITLLEPLTCKKLAHSMLTSIRFYRDYLVVSCQDGIISTYARPGRPVSLSPRHRHYIMFMAIPE